MEETHVILKMGQRRLIVSKTQTRVKGRDLRRLAGSRQSGPVLADAAYLIEDAPYLMNKNMNIYVVIGPVLAPIGA